MGKIFYTERDIEDMAHRGERSLQINDDVVLTDLAYESARRLGVQLQQEHDTPPAAPIRPYVNRSNQQLAPVSGAFPAGRVDAIKARVKTAVRQQLGDAVDNATLDRIIERVAADLGLK